MKLLVAASAAQYEAAGAASSFQRSAEIPSAGMRIPRPRSTLLEAGFLLLLAIHGPLLAQSDNEANREATASVTTAPPAYQPMTEDQRLHEYLKSVVNPIYFMASAAGAAYGQWRDRPEEWKEGARGYGLRYGSSFAEHVTQQTLMFGAASLLHEDNRYFRSQETGFGSRLKYALASPFLARNDNGARRVSISHIGALAGAAFLSRLWQPHSTDSLRSAGINLGSSVGVSMGFDVVREFWPHH